MTSNDTQAAAPTVLLRSEGEVDEETLAYAREKIDAAVGRPGLPAATGEVRITRAAAHHASRPWTATAALHVGERVTTCPTTVDWDGDGRPARRTARSCRARRRGHRPGSRRPAPGPCAPPDRQGCPRRTQRPPDGGPAMAWRSRYPASCRRKRPDGGLSPGVSPCRRGRHATQKPTALHPDRR